MDAVQINIEVPEDIASNFGSDASSLQRAAMEALAVEGVRSGRLSRGQARRMLGFGTRYEVDGFMKEHGVPFADSFDEVRTSSDAILSQLL